eukprot:2454356-Pyramimonas_sp.AAC.1
MASRGARGSGLAPGQARCRPWPRRRWICCGEGWWRALPRLSVRSLLPPARLTGYGGGANRAFA